MRTKMLNNYVLIEPIAEDKSKSGIIISANEKAPQKGKIIACSPEGSFSEGEIVIFAEYSDEGVEINGHKYGVVKEEDILARIED